MYCRNALPFVALTLAATLLAACSGSGETKPEPIPAPPVEAVPPAAPAPAPAPQADLSQHSLYFDFDKSVIKPEGLPVVGTWAGYLVAHPTEGVRIEGNCDERGTREYNIGLGERRANAVAQALEARGVAASQVELISYGKERPLALGHDEASWAKNRRADLIQK
jgi:peptidoglycan-associated lipoprotein